METFDWQLPIAILLVAGAGFVLIRRAVRLFSDRSNSCGSAGCGSYDTDESKLQTNIQERPFVSIDSLNPANQLEETAVTSMNETAADA